MKDGSLLVQFQKLEHKMPDEKIYYEDNLLKIGDQSFELEYPVRKILVQDETVLVLLSPPSGENPRDNIVAFSVDGEHLWRISPPTAEPTTGAQTYIDLEERNDTVVASNWNGGKYKIDLDTGEVEAIAWDPR